MQPAVMSGREDELATIHQVLAAAADGRAATMLLRGAPGIGKTALLRAVGADAGTAGWVVLQTAGHEFGQHRPRQSVRDLLADLHRQRSNDARQLRVDRAMTPLDFHAQLLTELTDAAVSQPILVLLDDAHWLDDASTLALAFVLRRLDRDRVAVLAATRPTRRSWLQGLALVEIDLPGLDVGSAAALLDRAGQPNQDVVARCVAGTGGNPLALLELSRLLSDGQLLGDEPLPEPLPIGVTTEEAVNARLHEASAQAARAACLVAIEESGEVGLLQRALRRTGLEWSSVDELERLRLVDIGDGVVSWTHPLHRLGAYHALPGPSRRELHRALADELVEIDPSRRAWHLRQAAIGPDESISAELAATAGELDRRGALNHAGSAYEWSAQSTSDRTRRLDLLWSSADCFRRGGRLDDTCRVARRAVKEAPTTTDATRHILLLGEAETWAVGPGEGAALLLSHAERLTDDDPLRPLVRCYAAIALLLAGEVGRMVEVAALDRPVGELDPFVVTLSGLAHGHALAECGDLEHGEPELDAARPLVDELIDVAPAEADTLVYLLAVIDIALERFGSTETLLRRLMAQSLRLGLSTGFAGLFLADILWRTGRWLESHALVSQLVDLSREEHQTTQQMAGAALLGRAEACLGRTVAGTRLAGEALEYASSTGNGIVASWARSGLALSALAAGRVDEAHGHLDRLRGDIRRWGGDLPGVLWWQGDYLAVLIALQERRRATDELERLRESSQIRSSRWVQATVLVSEARLSADDPGPVIARAAELLAAIPAPFEHGRALLAWAEHAGADDAGRSSARRAACQLFESLGAVPWAARALAGGNEARTEPVVETLVARLTPAELRVAVAVGSGASNKEVARRLFVSTKTVEFHLGHIYAKLGLSGRGGLIRLVAAESSNAERAASRRPLATAD
jgi:DNA-binding CsgD family transcriptional regulator